MSAVSLVRPALCIMTYIGTGHMIHYVNQYSTITTMHGGESCAHTIRYMVIVV